MTNFIRDNTSLPATKADGDSLTASEFNTVGNALADIQTVMRAGGYSGVISESITYNGTAYALTTSTKDVNWTNVFSLLSAMSLSFSATDPGGRLTLSTGVPFLPTDSTGATTIYFTPYKSNRMPIWDGTNWRDYSFTELSNITTNSATGSAGPAAVAASSNYDLFVWLNGSTLTLTRGAAWTSSAVRGSGNAISRQDGRYLNTNAITNGPGALRGTYVGTVRSDASSQINDSVALRHVWNMYNRIRKSVQVSESTDTWAYSTATWRQANGSAANQIDIVRGLDEDVVDIRCKHAATNSTSTVRSAGTGIGVDSTSAISGFPARIDTATGRYEYGDAFYVGTPGLGRHFFAWLEIGAGTDTQTWAGDLGTPTLVQNGIFGNVIC